MNRSRIAILAVLVIAMIAFAIWWLSPVQVLKRRTDSLLSTLTLNEGSGFAARQSHVYRLNALLDTEVTLDGPAMIDAAGTYDHEEIEAGFSQISRRAKKSHFETIEFGEIVISNSKRRATMDVKIDAMMDLGNFRPVDGEYDVTLIWTRADDGWRLTQATWTES